MYLLQIFFLKCVNYFYENCLLKKIPIWHFYKIFNIIFFQKSKKNRINLFLEVVREVVVVNVFSMCKAKTVKSVYILSLFFN